MNSTFESGLDPFDFLEIIRKINIFSITFIIILGLIGHALTTIVYSQKKSRNNSINLFLLCLAINDSSYLIVHFWEDTVRTIQEIYLKNNSNLEYLINILNIVDASNFTCITISYLKYTLRFTSAYLIVAISIQRLIIVCLPLKNKYKSKLFAWYCIVIIIICSIISNLWVLFMFKIKSEYDQQMCDVTEDWIHIYFKFSLIYIGLIIVIPIIVIFICNLIIILKTYEANIKLGSLRDKNLNENNTVNEIKKSGLVTSKTKSSNLLEISNFKPLVSSNISLDAHNRTTSISNSLYVNSSNTPHQSKKTTKTLILISFSYPLLCFPHLITWSMFFTHMALSETSDSSQNTYLFAWVQITEIFLVLNYSVNSFFYCLSSKLFRSQLKNFFTKFISNK